MKQSLAEYGRGVAGGLLFSLPLLFTMEMWWTGFTVHFDKLVIYVLATFVLLLAYNRYAGMHPGAKFNEVVVDSVEEMGLGMVMSFVMLFLIGQIDQEHTWREVIGKVVVEGMVVAIGFSVGTAQLGGNGDEEESKSRDNEETPDAWGEVLIGFCGATLICANVAPTEEILKIAVETTEFRLLTMAILSLAVAMLILEYSGFKGSKRIRDRSGIPGFLFSAVVTYGIAVAAAAFQLWFFGRFEGSGWTVSIGMIVVLGLPATLGASAGRLLLGGKG